MPDQLSPNGALKGERERQLPDPDPEQLRELVRAYLAGYAQAVEDARRALRPPRAQRGRRSLMRRVRNGLRVHNGYR